MLTPPPRPADLLRADLAPPPAGLYLHLASPSYYAPVQGVVLSSFPFEFETHWVDPVRGPEVVCFRKLRACPYCNLEARWHAALCIKLSANGGLRLVKVSAHAARNCTSGHFRNPAKPIRGWWLQQFRDKGGKAGRLRVELFAPPKDDPSLPVCPDVAAIIANMYRERPPVSQEGGPS
jgi:hypothetical protein